MKIFYYITILWILSSCIAGSEIDTLKTKGILKADYQLVWSDLFTDENIDTAKWTIEVRDPGWVNNELQAYTGRRDNLHIDNNNLIIMGIKENYLEAKYTSGRMNTSGKANWKYGRFEIRARVPKQKGIWPAIWLLSETIFTEGWPKCGEIDIMEHVNNEDIIYGTIHSEKYNHMTNTSIGGNMTIKDLDADFHTFGLEWDSEALVWFIDDKEYYRINKADHFDALWPFDKDYFLIINQAIGGFWPGDPEKDFKTTKYVIDWVKVYQ